MKLDLELIKKKSEHNEGLIEELEEISLHQLQIKKIECINIHCRNLKILLLQNNLIEKIENLSQMKKLEYLNLALNNITVIENLEKCESLRKLDLTLNFIDVSTIERSINNLKKNEKLKELYMMGNPCASWEHLKFFIIFHLENLQVLDGSDILMSDRIKSKQNIVSVLKTLEEEKKKCRLNENEPYDSINKRKEIYEEIEQNEMEQEKNENKNKNRNAEKEILPVYTDEGDIRQCNEGHYKFMFDEYSSRKFTYLKLFLPKYLCNSLIKIDININYVRCIIKNKLFQIKLNDCILTDFTKIYRKKYTGELHIKMRKKNYKKNKIFERDYFKGENFNTYANTAQLHSTLSSSPSSVSSRTSSFSDSSCTSFKNNHSIKENKRKNSKNFMLPFLSEKDDSFLLEEKQTKYCASLISQIPPLEKIAKGNS
ncbi:leucine-rich repeat protein, putative [Plasmodium malariae]|uniref:Leucine-rich repeat protein, putative n=1 Tax=Plasmodium malariae TaxID=5858 RepID=A0A1D3TF57_PLAMA|nr:leucine-rich repeat protein, putative [Plasmodium malariae]SCP03564.1 leucine-rich repeat protein, putative [Plasmodium malariae]